MSDIEEDNSDLAIINDETINWVEVVTRRLFAKYAVAASSAPLVAASSAPPSAAASAPPLASFASPIKTEVKKFKDYFDSILPPQKAASKYDDAGIYRLVYGEYALDEQTIGYAQTKTKEIERRLTQFKVMTQDQPVNHREVLFFDDARNVEEFKDKKLMYRLKLRPLCLNLCFIPQLNGNFNIIKERKEKKIYKINKSIPHVS